MSPFLICIDGGKTMNKGKKILLIVLCYFLTFFNLAGQDGWIWQNPKPQGNVLTDVVVFDDNSAIAVGGSSTILKTTNSGIDWNVQHRAGGTASYLNDVSFVGENTGWAVAAGESFSKRKS